MPATPPTLAGGAGSRSPGSALIHDALIYSSDDEFLGSVVPFVQAGEAAGEPTAVVTTRRNIELLGSVLGAAGEGVEFRDAAEWYQTPAGTIASYHRLVDAHLEAGAPAVRVVGEVAFGDGSAQQREWTRYEAILNRSFAPAPVWILCPYDTRTLPEHVTAGALRTHPHVVRGGDRRGSSEYRDPTETARRLAPPLPSGSGSPVFEMEVGIEDLARARHALAGTARAAGATPQRVNELVTGLHEIVINAVVHGRGRARVRCWRDGGRVLCEVVDWGTGLDDPVAGFVPPGVEGTNGRGLWLTRQLYDSVDLRRRRGGGTVVRMAATC